MHFIAGKRRKEESWIIYDMSVHQMKQQKRSKFLTCRGFLLTVFVLFLVSFTRQGKSLLSSGHYGEAFFLFLEQPVIMPLMSISFDRQSTEHYQLVTSLF